MELVLAEGNRGQPGNYKSIARFDKVLDDFTDFNGRIYDYQITKGDQSLFLLTYPKDEF